MCYRRHRSFYSVSRESQYWVTAFWPPCKVRPRGGGQVRLGEDGGVTVDTPDPAAMRREYPYEIGLSEADLAADWPAQFGLWFTDAVAAGLPEPNAMVVATADAAGRPSARTVLLKEYDARGFVFYTNYR